MRDDEERARSSDPESTSKHSRFREGNSRLYRVEMVVTSGDFPLCDSREFKWIGGKRIFTCWILYRWLRELFYSLSFVGEMSEGESSIYEDGLLLATQEWSLSSVIEDDISRIAGQAFTIEKHLQGKENICQPMRRMLLQQPRSGK